MRCRGAAADGIEVCRTSIQHTQATNSHNPIKIFCGFAHALSKQKELFYFDRLRRAKLLAAIALDTRFRLDMRLFVRHFNSRYRAIPHTCPTPDAFRSVNARPRRKQLLQSATEDSRYLLDKASGAGVRTPKAALEALKRFSVKRQLRDGFRTKTAFNGRLYRADLLRLIAHKMRRRKVGRKGIDRSKHHTDLFECSFGRAVALHAGNTIGR